MNKPYYLVVDGQQIGPFTVEELKVKNIQRDTLVWTEGLLGWAKAEDIPQLKEILQVSPPPIYNMPHQTFPPPIYNTPHQSFSPQVSHDKYFGYQLASRWSRFWASLIDGFIMVVVLLPTYALSPPIAFAFSLLVSSILRAIFYLMWGGNLGHKIMGLQVISSQTGEIQKQAQTGAIRELLKTLLSYLLIPAIWLLWDDNKQNLYDKIMDTYVVKRK